MVVQVVGSKTEEVLDRRRFILQAGVASAAFASAAFSFETGCAQAQETGTTLSKEERLNQSVFSAIAIKETARTRRYEIPQLLQVTMYEMQQNPRMDSKAALRALNARAMEVEGLRREAVGAGAQFSDYDGLSSILEVGKTSSNPDIKIGSSVLKETVAGYKAVSAVEGEPAVRAEVQDYLGLLDRSIFQARNNHEAWSDIWEYAQTNPQFAQTADRFLRIYLNISPSQNAEELLVNNPDFKDASIPLRKILLLGAAEPQDLNNLIKATTGKVQADLKDVREKLEGLTNSEKSRLAQAEVIKAAEEQNQVMGASISIGTSLIHIFGGAEAARTASQFGAMGNAMVGLHKAFSDFGLNPGAAGGIILTGTVLGIGFGLVNALIGGPSAEQLILEQLKELREELNEFRKEVREYVQAIDKKLDIILASVVDGFDAIHKSLSSVQKTTKQIQQELEGVRFSLNTLRDDLVSTEYRLYEYVKSGFERDYEHARKEYIEYEDRFKTEIPEDIWREGLTYFVTRALNDVRDALTIGTPVLTPADVTNTACHERLRRGSLTKHVNYLADVAGLRFNNDGMKQGKEPLPDIAEWIVACRHYIRLIEMAPEHLHTLEEKDLNDLIDQGQRIKSALRNIKAVKGEERLEIRDAFLFSLVTNYEEALATLRQTTEQGKIHFQEDWLGGTPLNDEAALPISPPLIKTLKQTDQSEPLPPGAEFYKLLPEDVLRLHALSMGKAGEGLTLEPSYSVKFTDKVRESKDWQVISVIPDSQGRSNCLFNLMSWTEHLDYQQVVLTVKLDIPGIGTVMERDFTHPDRVLTNRECAPNLPGYTGIVWVRSEIPWLNRYEQHDAAVKRGYPNALINVRPEDYLKSAETGVRAELIGSLKAKWESIMGSPIEKWDKEKVAPDSEAAKKLAEHVKKLRTDRVSQFESEVQATVTSLSLNQPAEVQLLRAADASQLKDALRNLDGARAFIGAYLQLGLPVSCLGHGGLVSGLYSEHRLLDIDGLSHLISENPGQASTLLSQTEGILAERAKKFRDAVTDLVSLEKLKAERDLPSDELNPALEEILFDLRVALEKVRTA